MNSYAQRGEDRFVVDRGHEIKTVLDIGANNGITFSNSRHFIETQNAVALLVEPDVDAFAKLFDLYRHNPRVKLVHGLLTGDTISKLAAFYPFADSLISTASENYRELWSVPPRGEFFVPALTWAMLTGHFGFRFDLISIDPEGMSPELVQSMPMEMIQSCKIMILERGHKPAPEGIARVDNPLTDFHRLIEGGMRLVHETDENLIYERA